MKKIRFVLFALFTLATTVLHAQVIEAHLQNGYVSKQYMNRIDSLVYEPAQDWSITLKTDSFYMDKDSAVHVVASVTVGPDAHVAKAAIGKGLQQEHIVYDSVKTVPLQAGMTQNVDFVVPNPEETCNLYVVTKNNCNAWSREEHWNYYMKSASVDYSAYEEKKGWKVLGQASVTEDLLTTFFGVDNITFLCEVQENEHTPGHFRLKNPYTSCFPYNSKNDYDATENYYVEIHAEDPEAVYIEKTPLGMDWGYGMFWMWSYADYQIKNGKTPEEVKAAGLYGTLKNGVITFPQNALLISMEDYQNGGFFRSNSNGMFRVQLPVPASAKKKAARLMPATLELAPEDVQKMNVVDKKSLFRPTGNPVVE